MLVLCGVNTDYTWKHKHEAFYSTVVLLQGCDQFACWLWHSIRARLGSGLVIRPYQTRAEILRLETKTQNIVSFSLMHLL